MLSTTKQHLHRSGWIKLHLKGIVTLLRQHKNGNKQRDEDFEICEVGKHVQCVL